jgi:uncharacterized protein (TIGR03083 family)
VTESYELRRMVEAEQRDFVAMLRGLRDEQWLEPSLCAGWSIHDAVLHIAWHTHNSDVSRVVELLKFRNSESALHAHDKLLPKDELIDKLASPAVLAGPGNIRTQLAELVIHQQDVRRPLDIPREIPADRLSLVLDFALTRNGGGPFLASSRKRAKGLRLVASDIDWSAGTGPEVLGPGEALYMALNGRGDALTDLKGDGVSLLAARVKA